MNYFDVAKFRQAVNFVYGFLADDSDYLYLTLLSKPM